MRNNTFVLTAVLLLAGASAGWCGGKKIVCVMDLDDKSSHSHSWQNVVAAGSSIGLKGAHLAAKTLALTTAELFQSPETVAAAKTEFERRRGPDFHYRALLGDRAPALNYRD